MTADREQSSRWQPWRSQRWPVWAVAGALWLCACSGRRMDGGADTNTNWLGHCDESDQPCTPLPGGPADPDSPAPAPAPDLQVPPPSSSPPPSAGPGREVVWSMEPSNPFEFGTVDSCVVGCDALLPGPQCRGGLDALPDLRQTLLDWQMPGCNLGELLEGICAGGTRFVWKGGAASEVRYFTAEGGFIGLSSFSTRFDPSTCNGVRRWPQQIACDAPSVTRELCAEP